MNDMPRYGNLDALELKWILATPEQKKNFKQIIEEHPAVDVVPKSEVEKIFEEIEKEITWAIEHNYCVRTEFEDSTELYHSINGRINALRGMDYFIAELKKKYTED